MALRDELAGVLADGVHLFLDDGPGWQVESAGSALIWNVISPPQTTGQRVQWSVTHPSGLQADVVLERDPDYSAAILQVTLTEHHRPAIAPPLRAQTRQAGPPDPREGRRVGAVDRRRPDQCLLSAPRLS